MNTAPLKRFAQAARRQLMEQVATRLELVLHTDSAELREQEKAINQLIAEIAANGKETVVERIAYIWFNRFCALRFMDVNRYTSIGVVSPAEGFTQPEILQEAKSGHIDDDLQIDSKRVFDLLGGRLPGSNPQQEAYRMLLVAECNRLNRIMPFLFQQIRDYTELLMVDDLLSENSILTALRETLTEETCQDVEVIGWLYQFYISEKKDLVFEGLKKNKKITPENIPAATQLFTPHWIVRYLVENSLGRLWLLNRPNSNLASHMDYYIKPEEPETDFLKVSSPEELKICDPACGSGHMLTYAFDLLYQIYEEEGYDAKDIPGLILTKNLYGIEIDERAGELAAFALTMKARGKYRRFFRKVVQPNICVLENVSFEDGELKPYIELVGRDLFTNNLQALLHQFEEADNFGSLIRPAVEDVEYIRQVIKEKRAGEQLAVSHVHPRVMRVLEQAEYLSCRYHVVVANPPYMGGKGMNGRLGAWLKGSYSDVKSDLFSAFVVRNTELSLLKGQLGFMTPFVWMFISSYEKLRRFLIDQKTITSLVQLEYSGFDGATVPICTFTFGNSYNRDFKGSFIRLVDFRGSANQAPKTIEAIKNQDCGWFYSVSSEEFNKIPGSPIAYWPSYAMRNSFTQHKSLAEIAKPKQGLATTDNDRFLRYWFECSDNNMNLSAKNSTDALESGATWFPCQKGGSYRKWYGNNDYVVQWKNNGAEIKQIVIERYGSASKRVVNEHLYFKQGLTWSTISSSSLSMRYVPHGFIFETKGSMCFFDTDSDLYRGLGFCNSNIINPLLKCISPTLDYHEGPIGKLPIAAKIKDEAIINSKLAIAIATTDWDLSETSWGFTRSPLLNIEHNHAPLDLTFTKVCNKWSEMVAELKGIEKENNCIYIEAYNLQDELTPEVPLHEITLNCNPHYRYGVGKKEEEYETLLRADTMREFLSYAVGCMLGRYSLDKPGLVLANQGETLEDYLKQIPEPTFMPDEDNVIPILDADWFMDDIVARFRVFLKTTFGEEHYEENLKFIEEAIGKDIRKYFLKDFYTDHIKRYKKRPIYWLFSSPKGSFNALIYMHRYRPDTVSVILNDYLREFRTKLTARKEHLEQVSISASASKTEKNRALKEIEKLKKTIDELTDYENNIIYPLATEQMDIDLDDGVKVNYKKFGKALKKVAGLS